VKEKSQKIGIRELFRDRLENAEIIPDASVRSDLMRKLGRKEFLRFNPSRINIYYIGGIVAVGIAAALILSSGLLNRGVNRSNYKPAEPNQVLDTNFLNINNEKPADQKTDILVPLKNAPERQVGSLKSEPPALDKERNVNPVKSEFTSSDLTKSFSGKVQFKETGSDNNKLKGRSQQAENLIAATVTEGCTPLKVRFTTPPILYDSCRWSFGDGGFSNSSNPEWIFDTAGDYIVTLRIFGPDGSIITSLRTITVHPRPAARFEISRSDGNSSGNEIAFLNYSSDAVRFKWNFGDGNASEFFEPRYKYLKSGNYNVMLVAYSEFGCSDTLVVLNAFTGSTYYIRFPNAFIPNPGGPAGGYYSTKSDEAAQVFHPVFSGVSDYQLRIFSKLGIPIFESNDINIGWDGYFKGQLCEKGVYIWKVRGSYLNGEPFTKMGDVTLLKN
jgi:PKD repeat protein